MRAVTSLLVLAALACGCQSRRDAPADPFEPIPMSEVDLDELGAELSTDEAIARVADRSLAAYERAAEALERAGDDCEAATQAVREIVLSDGAAIARGKALSHAPELLARARPLLERRAARTAALTARFGAALERCAGHPPLVVLLAHF